MNHRPRRHQATGLSLWLMLVLLLAQPLGWWHGLSHLRTDAHRPQVHGVAHVDHGGHETDSADALCLQCLAHAPLAAALPGTPPRWQPAPAALAAPAAPALPNWSAPACAPCARDPPGHLS